MIEHMITGIGTSALQMMTNVSTSQFYNAESGVQWSNNMAMIVLAVIVAAGLVAVTAIVSSLDRYKKFWDFVSHLASWITDFIICAIVGAVTIGLLILAYLAIKYTGQNAGSIDYSPLGWFALGAIACAVVGFVVITGFTWVVGRVKGYQEQIKTEAKKEEVA